MSKKILSVDELLKLNEMMVGRGMPNRDDGVGYNKADYSICSTYFYGLSDSQIADLAKRLVKYSNTQLNIDKDIMKNTSEHYNSLADINNKDNGISVDITSNGTLISFRYNPIFIDVIKSQPKRQYDADNKQWIVPNENVVMTLKALKDVGADVDNALEYIGTHSLIKSFKTAKETVLTKFNNNDNVVFLKFNYNKDIIDEIKRIDKNERKWNAEHKYWTINRSKFDELKKSLNELVEFKIV